MNMTWGEFKKTVEKLGAKDWHFVSTIDLTDPVEEKDIFVRVEEIKSSVFMLDIIGGDTL